LTTLCERQKKKKKKGKNVENEKLIWVLRSAFACHSVPVVGVFAANDCVKVHAKWRIAFPNICATLIA